MGIPNRKLGLKYLVLGITPITVLLGLAELIVRIVPGEPTIHRQVFLPAGHMEYYGTARVFIPYAPLSPYYWLPVPNAPGINRFRLRGHEIDRIKPPGRLRIACMGDSCTLGGQEPYPERLERLLGECFGTNNYEVINGGVGAHSTYQGLLVLEEHILELRPDVVTVYYGWNDRWVQDGQRDSKHHLPSPGEIKLVQTLSKSKLIRVLLGLAGRLRNRHLEQRVPVEEYGDNLARFVSLCRQRGIRVVLCTTPDGMTAEGAETRFVRDTRPENWYRDVYDLFKDKGHNPAQVWNYLQKLYNDKVCEIAATHHVELIDLDTLIAKRRKLYQESPHYFFKDGIHFTELGLQEVASVLASSILMGEERNVLERYLVSPIYFRVNAEKFVRQQQFATADLMLTLAEACSSGPVVGAVSIRERIAADRPFYDMYDGAQHDLSYGINQDSALARMRECLKMRPTDESLRLGFAQTALDFGRPVMSLEAVTDRPPGSISRENATKLLWIGVESATQLGRLELKRELLQAIQRITPEDPRVMKLLDGT